jgi:hypothetical protein
MTTIEVKIEVNKLVSLEKAFSKVEKVIKAYKEVAGNYHRTCEPNRVVWEKAIILYQKINNEHSAILSRLWDKGIFV